MPHEADHQLRLTIGGERPAIVPALTGLGGSNPRGDTVGFTNAYMTFNGKPWLPVAGEFHYSRCPAAAWRDELLKMKAGGVDVVSTYVFWIHHEELRGTWDWTGDRDLGRFIRTCAEAGVYAIIRVGPFAHGEVRNGGFPDWLYGTPVAPRSNDERYLALARALFTEIGRQVHGLFFQDGGPIIAVQLENELDHASAPWETVPRQAQEWVATGPDGEEHLRALKRIALQAGLSAPIYTCTAWGGSPVPAGEMLPLHGGYAYRPWNVTAASPEHAPTREYAFRNFRDPGQRDAEYDPRYDPSTVPFACCEMGGGMQSWYRYRFIVQAESVEAMAVMKLAGGCAMLGYYMYHGGSNPVGKTGFLNEHVVPRISYDFQAPVGEFGQVRESYRRLRRLHLMCRYFAGEILPAEPVLPRGAEEIDPRDTETVRFAARARVDSGFLFLNNYQDHATTKDHEGVQVQIDLPGGPVRFPDSGAFTLKANACAVLPFNIPLGSRRLISSTAQPLGRLSVDGADHVFFFEHPGIPAEYCVEESGTRRALHPCAGLNGALELGKQRDARLVLHTLTDSQSLQFSILPLWGRDRVVITPADVFAEEGDLHVRTMSPEPVDAWVFPAPERPLAARGAQMEAGREGPFARLTLALPERPVPLEVRRHGPADVEILISPESFGDAAEVLLSIEYDGDVANAFIDGALVADDFSNGTRWEIGLRRFAPLLAGKGLYVHVTPRREGTVVIRESAMAARQELRGREIARLGDIEIRAVREAVLS